LRGHNWVSGMGYDEELLARWACMDKSENLVMLTVEINRHALLRHSGRGSHIDPLARG